jgi:hypothetical protein
VRPGRRPAHNDDDATDDIDDHHHDHVAADDRPGLVDVHRPQ